MPRKVTVTVPAPVFQPITLVIGSKTELANILGALMAYGIGSTYAEKGLKAVGLGDYYSGNVRKAARELATVIATASSVVPLPEFTDYLNSVKFKQSHPSTAGAAVIGTEEDLAAGRTATTFEEPAEVEEDFDAVDDEFDPDYVS